MKVNYEWCLETVDEYDDIQDLWHDDLKNLPKPEANQRLVLVRDEGDDWCGLQDRAWAYVKDNQLPQHFDGYPNMRVPVKLQREFQRWAK